MCCLEYLKEKFKLYQAENILHIDFSLLLFCFIIIFFLFHYTKAGSTAPQ